MAKRTAEDPLEQLTPREQEVLALLRFGLTDAAIAERLSISQVGASYHVSEIIGKRGVRNRHEAAAWPDPPPWWTKALAPFVVLWRKTAALPNYMALAAIGATAIVVIGGVVLMAALLVRANASTDHLMASAVLRTKPPQFATPVAVAGRSTAAPTSTSTIEPNDGNEPLPNPPTATVASTPELGPGARLIDGCVVSVDAVEIFPPEAAARGQRVFDDEDNRWYLRANGTCVHLFKNPDMPAPDFAPDTIDTGTPIGF